MVCVEASVSSKATVKKTVLVVDDSALIAERVKALINGFDGYEVVGTGRDGEDAARLVHQLDPDLVTLDIEMPGVDGLQALGYIMSEAPRPVVIQQWPRLSGAISFGTMSRSAPSARRAEPIESMRPMRHAR